MARTGTKAVKASVASKAKASAPRPVPTAGSDTAQDINLESQTRRLLELYALAQSEGNLSVASQSLKQLSDLHGLAKGQNLDADSLNDMSDETLDDQIHKLLKETGLADALADLSPAPADRD